MSKKQFYIVIFFVFFIRHIICYKSHQLSEFCSLKFGFFSNSKQILFLESGMNSAGIIQQSWNLSHFKIKKFHSPCEFKINTFKNKGFIVFLQKLNLRKNHTSGNCIDYLKIIYSDKHESGEICGELGSKINKFQSFKEPKGKMKINIKIDFNVSLKDDETLDLTLIITAYSECLHNPRLKQFACLRDNTEMCIDSTLENDSYMNCPLPFCLDEGSCFEIDKTKVINTSTIAISAITSLIFTMVGVGSCIWMCFKHRECLRQCAGSANNRDPGASPNIEMQTVANNGEERRVITQSQVKDLPPSYDSLFPE